MWQIGQEQESGRQPRTQQVVFSVFNCPILDVAPSKHITFGIKLIIVLDVTGL